MVICSDCRKTLILVIVPIKSAGKFEYRQSKGDAFSCKASPLEKQPTGLFCQELLTNPLFHGINEMPKEDLKHIFCIQAIKRATHIAFTSRFKFNAHAERRHCSVNFSMPLLNVRLKLCCSF